MDLSRIKLGLTEDMDTVYWKSRYTHCGCFGKSGGGKTVLIENGVYSDAFSRNAQIILDPSGELALNCYGILKGKAHFLSLDHPVSLNLMKLPYNSNIICSITREAFNQTVTFLTPNQMFTTKMSSILDDAVTSCMQHGQFSLLSVRDRITKRTGDNETRDGILSRLNYILSDDGMNRILCGNDSLDIGDLIRKKESLIISCQSMTPEQYVFLGTLITQLISAYMRYEAKTDSPPVSVWIDECHMFVRHSFLEVLKQGRKYRISCFMATQDFAVMPETIRRVLLNVGTLISFRAGASEAAYLAREMNFKSQDLQFLPKFTFGYLTEEGCGIAKATRPVLIKKMEPKRPEPPKKSTGAWFPLRPYQPETSPRDSDGLS